MSENPVRDAIQDAIADHEIILFMKGTPERPMCGFSARTAAALEALGAEYAAVDILPDPRIRQELSAISNWPTIPQLFVKGELVGGCDIVTEMYESGELAQALGVEPPSEAPEPRAGRRRAGRAAAHDRQPSLVDRYALRFRPLGEHPQWNLDLWTRVPPFLYTGGPGRDLPCLLHPTGVEVGGRDSRGRPASTGPASRSRPSSVSSRARRRRFIARASIFFLAFFLTYLLLTAFAQEFMATEIAGMPLAFLLAVAQVLMTWGVTWRSICATCDREIEPLEERAAAVATRRFVRSSETAGSPR